MFSGWPAVFTVVTVQCTHSTACCGCCARTSTGPSPSPWLFGWPPLSSSGSSSASYWQRRVRRHWHSDATLSAEVTGQTSYRYAHYVIRRRPVAPLCLAACALRSAAVWDVARCWVGIDTSSTCWRLYCRRAHSSMSPQRGRVTQHQSRRCRHRRRHRHQTDIGQHRRPTVDLRVCCCPCHVGYVVLYCACCLPSWISRSNCHFFLWASWRVGSFFDVRRTTCARWWYQYPAGVQYRSTHSRVP